MDTADILEKNKQQIVDKANEFADNAKPYIDQAKPYVDKIATYAKAKPVEAMIVAGVAAFFLGSVLSGRRR